jgi:hypothetical protein
MKRKKHETHTATASISKFIYNAQIYLLKDSLSWRIDCIRLTQRIVMGCFEH